MDRMVGNTLGRPTALQDRDINTLYPHNPSLTTSRPTEAWLIQTYKIRQLQSLCIDAMYQVSIPYTPEFVPMIQQKLDNWLAEAEDPSNEWVLHSYHNLTITIYRPSKVNPSPSDDDLARCFTSSSAVITLYKRMLSHNAIDCTWMAMHWLFLACMTHLFCLWTSETVRTNASWNFVNEDLQSAIAALSTMVERWHWGRGCRDLYIKLARGTLRRFASVISLPSTPSAITAEIPRAFWNMNMEHPSMFQPEGNHLDCDMDYIMGFQPASDGGLSFLDSVSVLSTC